MHALGGIGDGRRAQGLQQLQALLHACTSPQPTFQQGSSKVQAEGGAMAVPRSCRCHCPSPSHPPPAHPFFLAACCCCLMRLFRSGPRSLPGPAACTLHACMQRRPLLRGSLPRAGGGTTKKCGRWLRLACLTAQPSHKPPETTKSEVARAGDWGLRPGSTAVRGLSCPALVLHRMHARPNPLLLAVRALCSLWLLCSLGPADTFNGNSTGFTMDQCHCPSIPAPSACCLRPPSPQHDMCVRPDPCQSGRTLRFWAAATGELLLHPW